MLAVTPAKPWSVSVFETQRPHLTTFVRAEILPLLEDTDNRRIVVRAPVKCGKREMVEYIAMRDSVEDPTRVHAFLSAWHRTADADQREELKTQNMQVFSITTQKNVDMFIIWLKKMNSLKKSIVLHLDECDHGSGAKQMLSKVWLETRDIASIINILYSATPEEVLFSGEIEDSEHNVIIEGFVTEGHRVEYTPPSGYCGPRRFLDEGLVREAIPFFYKEGDTYALSPQGMEIVADLRASMANSHARNLIVLRLSYSDLGGAQVDMKRNKAIYQFLHNLDSFPELADFLVVVDKGDYIGIKNERIITERIQWSSSSYWRRQTKDSPILLVIDQTSSRSTEWACHDRIFATHDYRNVVQYTTVSQAQERVNHYEQRYGGFQPIRVYANTRNFKLSAGIINYSSFLNYEWKPRKIHVRTSPEPKFQVRSAADHTLHPECPETGLTEIEASRLLQRLGCYADISISTRVAGRISKVPTVSCNFLKVSPETWDTVWETYKSKPTNYLVPSEGTRIATRNPFLSAKAKLPDGKWQCSIRGLWGVRDYDADIATKHAWGMGEGGATLRIFLCYKAGELGVAVVQRTGWETKNTLHAYHSMYKERS